MNGMYIKLGSTLYKIADKLLQDEKLCKLLVYTNADPLKSSPIENPDELLGKNLILAPKLPEDDVETGAIITILVDTFSEDLENQRFSEVDIAFAVLMSEDRWNVNEVAQRPFLIMDRIHKAINGKNIEGLGKFYIRSGAFLAPSGTQLTGYTLLGSYSAFNQ